MIRRNTKKEYIVSTTQVEAPYGLMWQAAVFNRLPSGDVHSTMQQPLLIAEMGNGYVRVTDDLEVVPESKKIQPLSDTQFHEKIAVAVREKKQEDWSLVIDEF